MTKHTILFLAANPLRVERVALDEEARAIQEELDRSGYRDRFELVTRWAAQPLDLLREMRKLRPTVVHFSGHGAHGDLTSSTAPGRDVLQNSPASEADHNAGIFFQGSDGHPQLVTTTALGETFGAIGSSVKLVVLNACYSAMQAEALLTYVDCVACVSGPLCDTAAKVFAAGFYGGLAERQSVLDAYLQGLAAINLEGLKDAAKPQLKVRNGVDAKRLVLVELGSQQAATRAATLSPIPDFIHRSHMLYSADVDQELNSVLRFSIVNLDAHEQYWSNVPTNELKTFAPPPRWRFRLVRFADDADPLFDITVMNTSNIPIILSGLGIHIRRMAHVDASMRRSSGPMACKILTSDVCIIDMPHIHSSLVKFADRLSDQKIVLSGE